PLVADDPGVVGTAVPGRAHRRARSPGPPPAGRRARGRLRPAVESAVPPLPPMQRRRAGPSTGRVRIFATWGRAFLADAGDVPPPSQPRVVILVPSVAADMAGGAQVQAEGAARALSGALDVVVMARSLRVPPGVERSGGYYVLRRPVFPLA